MKVLVHTCCAPCLIYPYKMLKAKGFEIEVFFYNPNIHPLAEYVRRSQQVDEYADKLGIKIHKPPYEIKEFFRHINQKEEKPIRCNLCWGLRLEKTAIFAKDNNFSHFTTTLLVSPYQDHKALGDLGRKCEAKFGIKFFYEDFRCGFKEAVEESKDQDMYRQKYCGCLYSEAERFLKKEFK